MAWGGFEGAPREARGVSRMSNGVLASAGKKERVAGEQILGHEREKLEVLEGILERVDFATDFNSEIRRNICKVCPALIALELKTDGHCHVLE